MSTARTKDPDPKMPWSVWFGGLAVRTVFIAILIAITGRVSSPQVEHMWTIWDTPGDMIRVALGAGVCFWLAIHIFIVPKDEAGYRTWLYLGLIILPLSLLCAFAIW